MDEPARTLYLEIARAAGTLMGTCTRRNVGAVLICNDRVREVGWNGMERPRDLPACMEGACPRGQLSHSTQPAGSNYSNCIYFHAEFNVGENFRHAIGARNVEGWASRRGVTIASSSVPCEDCVRYAAWAGIELLWEGTVGDL
jgi:dCMP deaminase